MAGKGQGGVFLVPVPIPDPVLAQSPSGTDVGLLVIPDGVNMSVEVLSITVAANVLVADTTDPVTLTVEFHDDSEDSDADLVDAHDLLTGYTVLEGLTIWRGVQPMAPGDRLNAEFTRTTPDTAGQGYHIVLECRLIERSGD